jgi:hypothetical protein
MHGIRATVARVPLRKAGRKESRKIQCTESGIEVERVVTESHPHLFL